MGLIILPLLFGALGLWVFAIINSVRLFKNKEITIKEILLGLVISVSIFGLICLSYLSEGKAWVLSPVFRIPIFMVFIPFGFYVVCKTSNNQKIKYFATLALISVGLTGILGVIFNNIFFGLIDILGIEKQY
jgi:hypothetical protein